MKYLFLTAFIFIFSHNIYADEVVSSGSELTKNTEAVQTEPVIISKVEEIPETGLSSESSFKSAKIEFSKVKYYEYTNSPSYKPKERVIVGGIVPFIPIKSTIDASVEDPGLIQKSVSFMMYFKQNF